MAENNEEDEEMKEQPSKEEVVLKLMLRDFFEKVSEMSMQEQIQILKDFLDALDASSKESLTCNYDDDATQKVPVIKVKRKEHSDSMQQMHA